MKRYMETIGSNSDMSEWIGGNWVKYDDAQAEIAKLEDMCQFYRVKYESIVESLDSKTKEIDRLKKENEQLRADLYKALDYIHEGEE